MSVVELSEPRVCNHHMLAFRHAAQFLFCGLRTKGDRQQIFFSPRLDFLSGFLLQQLSCFLFFLSYWLSLYLTLVVTFCLIFLSLTQTGYVCSGVLLLLAPMCNRGCIVYTQDFTVSSLSMSVLTNARAGVFCKLRRRTMCWCSRVS